MSTATTQQIEANRRNASLSTGPRTEDGKSASARNAVSRGLNSKSLLPGEDPAEYQSTLDSYRDRYRNSDPELIVELAEVRWRARRSAAYEAQVLSLEIHKLTTDPALQALTEGLPPEHVLALAFVRLVESRVMQNLYMQEARLCRRAEKLRAALDQPRLPLPVPSPQECAAEIKNTHNEPKSPPARVSPVTVTRIPVAPSTANKTGRNDLCPCGSGVKFKRCCLYKPLSAAA